LKTLTFGGLAAPTQFQREAVCPHSAVRALAAVARERGIDALPERLIQEFGLEGEEADDGVLLEMAANVGLSATALDLNFQQLQTLGEAFPVVLRLKNNTCIIAVGFGGMGDVPVVIVRDPLAGDDELLPIDEFRLTNAWSGRVLMFKPAAIDYSDEEKPFGFGTFLSEAMRYHTVFRDVAAAAIILSFLAMASPIFFQLVFDRVLLHNAIDTLGILVAGMAVAVVFETIFTYVRQYLVVYATMKIDARINTKVFDKVLNLPMSYFERISTGVFMKNIQQVEKIRGFLTGQVFFTILDSVTLVVLLPMMFFYNVALASVVLGFTLLLCAAMAISIPILQERMMIVYEADAKVQSFLVESIQGMRTIKSLALDARKKREWGRRMAASINLRFDLMKLALALASITQPIQKVMTVSVIAIGAYLVFAHEMQVGSLIAFNLIAMRVVGPLVQIAGLAQQFQEAYISVKMLSSVMNQPIEQGRGRRGVRVPIKGQVEFQDIRFRYSPETPPALDRVSFVIPEGTIFGVMGRSGSGKTTVTRLLQGLHYAQEGIIRLDGHDLREMDLDWVRSNVGVVLQDNFLFAGTVRENIAAGKSSATIEDVMRAARLAGADEFIERMPRGFDTKVEEGAANMSGGQRQRLAIARALLPDPPVLILDEATSALDAESEAIVQSNLLSIAQGRTLIIISHRLSSLVPSNQIMVLDHGKVMDVAPHTKLLERCEIYRKLWDQQNRTVT
jgi:ATP-binding cassette subfamily B protein